MGETLNFEREALEHERKMAREELEREVAELRDKIRQDEVSLLARQAEIERLTKQKEDLVKNFPSREQGIKAALDHMKRTDEITDRLTAAIAERNRLLVDLRARYSDLRTYEEKLKEVLSPEEAGEIKFPPFTPEEEAWFKRGNEMTMRWGAEANNLIEEAPFTPEEEEWFKKGERRAA